MFNLKETMLIIQPKIIMGITIIIPLLFGEF